MRALLLALAVLAAGAAPAPAASVSWKDGQLSYFSRVALDNEVTAARGPERTRIHDPGDAIAVEPDSVPGACVLLDPHTVECRNADTTSISTLDGADRVRAEGVMVFLGEGDDAGTTIEGADPHGSTLRGEDGDDELTGAVVIGGEGNDRLTGRPGSAGAGLDGGAGDDVLVGTEGNDSLSGGDGSDRFEGRGGDDHLADGECCAGTHGGREPAEDVHDGGPGRDIVDYGARDTPLAVDLTAGTAGEDHLVAVEGAIGGQADDRLAGGAGPDRLEGREGDDVLLGHGGGDRLDGGRGADRLEGGDDDDALFGSSEDDMLQGGTGADGLHGQHGRDTLRGGDGGDVLAGGTGRDELDGEAGDDHHVTDADLVGDSVACGDGHDVWRADEGDGGGLSCEVVTRIPVPSPPVFAPLGHRGLPVAPVRGRHAHVTVHCRALLTAGVEIAGVLLYVGGRLAGRGAAVCGSFTLGDLKTRDVVRISLARRHRRLARRPRGLRATGVLAAGLEGGLPVKGRLRLLARRVRQ